MFFAYRCFRIKGTIRLKTCSKMALAGANNDTTTRQKQTQNHNTHRIRKNTKFSSKKVPQMGLFGAPEAPPGPPRTGQRAPGRPPGARMGTRRAHGYQNGPKKAPKWTQNVPKMDPKSIPIKAPWGNSLRRAAAANGQSGNSKLLNGSAECAERSNSHPDTKCRRWCEHDRFTDGAIFKFAEATFCGTR